MNQINNVNDAIKEIEFLRSLKEYVIICGNINKKSGCDFNEDIDENKLRSGVAFGIARTINSLNRDEQISVIKNFFSRFKQIISNNTTIVFYLHNFQLPHNKWVYIGVNFEEMSCNIASSGNLNVGDILKVIEYAMLTQIIQIPDNEKMMYVDSIEKMTNMIMENN